MAATNFPTIETESSAYAEAREHADSARARLVGLTARHPYLTRDLTDLGLSDAVARAILAEAYEVVEWTDSTYAAERPRSEKRQQVAGIVPSDRKTALPMITEFGVYLRSTCFSERQQLRDAITHLGTDSRQRLQHVHPVLHRYTIGSGAAVTGSQNQPGMDQVAAYLKARGEAWDGPADVLILGNRLDIDIPLGYSNRSGIAGVRHVDLDELLAADQYKGVPAV
ncbi:hypothetical protein [Gordonia iterans]